MSAVLAFDRDARAAQRERDFDATRAYAEREFVEAIQNDRQRVLVPREGAPETAAYILIDSMTGTAESMDSLAELIVAASRGEDVQLRAALMLSVAQKQFGDWEVARARAEE